ncbi:MAG: TRAP transporter small permease subunit [Saprospiraceae bacterium]|nr:TRAP transporter small permease subunit [Saprospiraceae bacterium]
MDHFLSRASQLIDQLNERVGQAVSCLTTLLVLLVCFDVVTRYFFSNTAAWIMELEWHLFALIFLFGAGYAFKHDKHVRVDLFYAKFSPKDQAFVNIIGILLFLIPWCLMVIYWSYEYALISYNVGETSPDPGGLPARYLIKFSVSIGMVFLFLQGISVLFKNLLIYRNTDQL